MIWHIYRIVIYRADANSLKNSRKTENLKASFEKNPFDKVDFNSYLNGLHREKDKYTEM